MNHFKKIVVILIATFLPRVNSTFGSNVHELPEGHFINIDRLNANRIEKQKELKKDFIKNKLVEAGYKDLSKDSEKLSQKEKDAQSKKNLSSVNKKIIGLLRLRKFHENDKSKIGKLDSEIGELKKEKERIENIINPIQAEMNRIYKAIKRRSR